MENKVRLIDANGADIYGIACYYGNNCYIEDVQEWLDEQPTIDPESLRPVGAWNDWGYGHLWQECSVCNYRVQYSYSRDCKYCPNCGARMKEREEQ